MNKGLQILPECYGDTTLIEVLEYKNPSHKPNISSVLSALSEKNKAKQTLIGIIDNDKRKPKQYNEYVKERETKNLIFKKHKERNHYLFVLKPALEKFLLNAAEQSGVDPEKYGFKDLIALKRVTKKRSVRTNNSFKQFVNSIKQKKKNSDVKTLRNWLIEILGEDH